MFSLADAIDKLVIENIKIFTIRERLLTGNLSDEEYVRLFDKMTRLNENRGKLCNLVDKKAKDIYNKVDTNEFIEKIKTYGE
jgi:hypothetical protein